MQTIASSGLGAVLVALALSGCAGSAAEVASTTEPTHSAAGDGFLCTPGWHADKNDTCALTVDLGDLTIPEVEFQLPPDPMSPELHLLVTEETCNSGQDAAGRIQVVSIDETGVSVSLILGVRPRDGGQTCPSNPATPFTVTLSEPLGERAVLDASLTDPRPLTFNRTPGEELPTGSECEQTPLMLQVTPFTSTAGANVMVSTTPEHCLVTDAWEGEVMVRLGSGDTLTGTRIEAGSTQPVVVTIPSGLTGDGYIMLVPDRDCEDVLRTADCHYPFAEIKIEAPIR